MATKVLAIETGVTSLDCDAIVTGVHSDGVFGPRLSELDQVLGGVIRQLVERQEISGKCAEVVGLLSPSGVGARQVIVVGLGDRDAWGQAAAVHAVGAAAKRLAVRSRQRVVFCLDDDDWGDSMVSAAICGALAACYGQDLYRAEKKLHAFDEILWQGASARALSEGTILGECVNLTRRLVNEGPSAMTPVQFAQEAAASAKAVALEIEVWDEIRLENERCGALLAVARGSAHPPRLVILRYLGAGPEQPSLALVGKGVTFDSGGYSLKPSDAMKTMKCDMAGAATVLGTMVAVARLKLPINVTGYMGLVENMVSGDAYKLGDVADGPQWHDHRGPQHGCRRTSGPGRCAGCGDRATGKSSDRPGDSDRCLRGGSRYGCHGFDDERSVLLRRR